MSGLADVVIAGVSKSLSQESGFHLAPRLHEFLTQEAARRGVDPSAIAAFAIGLLEMYVDETADGSAVVLGPASSGPGEPTSFEICKVPVSPDQIAYLLGSRLEEVRMGGWDDDPPAQLHLVRGTDA